MSCDRYCLSICVDSDSSRTVYSPSLDQRNEVKWGGRFYWTWCATFVPRLRIPMPCNSAQSAFSSSGDNATNGVPTTNRNKRNFVLCGVSLFICRVILGFHLCSYIGHIPNYFHFDRCSDCASCTTEKGVNVDRNRHGCCPSPSWYLFLGEFIFQFDLYVKLNGRFPGLVIF